MRGKHPNNENIGSPGLFSCKSLREFNSFHARYRVVKILILYDWHLLMLRLDYCWPMRPSARVAARTYRRCVFEKCFPSLHFTDNVVDLVSSVAIGLTFKDFLTAFRLFCHVLSTNRSCQTKGPKSKPEHMSAWIAYHTDPLECKVKLTYGWMSITEIFFRPHDS